MEKKLDELRREVESLRDDLRTKGSSRLAPPGGGATVYTPHPSMRFPFRIRPDERERTREVVLFVSADGGETWKEVSRAAPDAGGLPFDAPRDGRYLLTVSLADQGGNLTPAKPRASAASVVVVDRKRPEITFRTSDDDGVVTLDWQIDEENPDLSTFLLEGRVKGKWERIPVQPAMSGRRVLRPGTNGARLLIRDLAGNEVIGILENL
jgi:hypothetical protein